MCKFAGLESDVCPFADLPVGVGVWRPPRWRTAGGWNRFLLRNLSSWNGRQTTTWGTHILLRCGRIRRLPM